MITADLDEALAPWASTGGTWRPAPPSLSGMPGAYATTVAFRLAGAGGGDAGSTAASLAGRLRGLDWVAGVARTGGGYLTVTVTACALTALAARVTRAGSACARSSALAGTTVTAPGALPLASAATWQQARQRLGAAVIPRLAQAAGAQVTVPGEGSAQRQAPARSPAAAPSGEVADAIAFAGQDAIIYALASLPARARGFVDVTLAAAHHLGNPAYAVRYAHAHAASTLRQAATLGLGPGEAPGLRLLAHPSERSLLYELSWLPERVSGAARREQPDVLTRYLETVAVAYLGCQENCPAVSPGMPDTQSARELAAARLWLAAAAATVLRTGLCLLGVTAPERL